ncbi:MAG: DUF1444 family protein [Kouleothrix sp.]|jgi:uncharacterized protein YtpQ (UPF0354 family)|nr:DUF1444 family protein [Kouleothrix sp.]
MSNGHGDHHKPAQGNGAAPPMNPEQFAAYMEARLSLYDEIELLDRAGMELRLRANGADVTADLSSFYSSYARDPGQIDVVFETFVRAMLGIVPDRSTSDYAALAGSIYPMIKPLEMLVEVRERRLPMLAYREFLSDLMIAYVIDEGHSVAYINEDHLERWEVSVQDLHQRAIENLRSRTAEKVTYTSVGAGEQRLFIFSSGDGYDASRLLLSDILAGWAREIPGNLVIGIPNRDFLIAFSDANPEILRAVAAQVQADSAQRQYGLTDQLFTLVTGAVKEYSWE